MPGVACLGEKAEIRKAKIPDKADLLLELIRIHFLSIKRMGEQASKENDLKGEVEKEKHRFSHGGRLSPFTASLVLS